MDVEMEHQELTERIIGCAFRVFRTLGFGFLESVYENALVIELRRAGLKAEPQRSLTVYYEGVVVGEFVADVVVEDLVIVELKAVRTLAAAHEVQLVNYLTATGISVGLLLNFGERGVEVRRKIRELPSQPATSHSPSPFPVSPVHPVQESPRDPVQK
jgi:GxxExxY protein